ncbi:hybrid sensor histidine kinase/response regulator transcription factor [Alkaliflexus imshenetskii]|uniref:hybrid sensor histidine kinase/response regulator transcription factor n=1 Tax=Alkaliflexus imshenetskii TaxID=286730 RepID=UPI00047CB510|nr:ATP-binding protein [Alkaliflexus imshenetskii]
MDFFTCQLLDEFNWMDWSSFAAIPFIDGMSAIDNRVHLLLNIPHWQNEWLYAIVPIVSIAILYYIRRIEISRINLRSNIKQAETETRRLKELDQIKSQFFENISHELRTPLTLIKGPLEQIIQENRDPDKTATLQLIHSNTQKILHQINQLLDLSKLESGDYKVSVSKGNIVYFLQGLVMSFASLAEHKEQSLSFNISGIDNLPALNRKFYYDRDIIEKIINNLLSNAIKFTQKNGRIALCISELPSLGSEGMLEIVVEDSGIGIPADKLPYIYNRFYRVGHPTHQYQEGSGIGLAFVKELVRVHHGEITAFSEEGKGTSFKIHLPLGIKNYCREQITCKQSPLTRSRLVNQSKSQHNNNTNNDKNLLVNEMPIILVVEDHEEVSQYIHDCLRKHFNIIIAESALDALELAKNKIPDLIISDVMMPGKDGFSFCKEIKSNDATSHIPLMLLTAKATNEDKIQGLKNGADDYLTKPFNPGELLLRASNLIESRRLLKQKFNKNTIIKPGEISVTPRDKLFIEKLIAVIELNMSNEKFSVADLAREAGMSQSQIHRKLKAVIGQTAIQFIRSIRMGHAKKLLEHNSGNITDIAYMVGYSDPGYFSKSYLAFFGHLPSEAIKRNSATAQQ